MYSTLPELSTSITSPTPPTPPMCSALFIAVHTHRRLVALSDIVESAACASCVCVCVHASVCDTYIHVNKCWYSLRYWNLLLAHPVRVCVYASVCDIYVCLCVCVYVCMYVCVCVYWHSLSMIDESLPNESCTYKNFVGSGTDMHS